MKKEELIKNAISYVSTIEETIKIENMTVNELKTFISNKEKYLSIQVKELLKKDKISLEDIDKLIIENSEQFKYLEENDISNLINKFDDCYKFDKTTTEMRESLFNNYNTNDIEDLVTAKEIIKTISFDSYILPVQNLFTYNNIYIWDFKQAHEDLNNMVQNFKNK